jgi:hypothetical protein
MLPKRILYGLRDVVHEIGEEITLLKRMKIMVLLCLGLILLVMTDTVQALVITSPRSGETFHEGDTVKLVAELSPNDPEILYVNFFITKDGGECSKGEITTHPRYECTFTIPSGSPRSIKVWAVGALIEGAISSPKITILVALPPTVTLQELKAFTGNTSNKLFFFQIGQNKRLHVDGIYSDGVDRDLSLAASGTIYTSSDENIVTIDGDGLVTAKNLGTAHVTIKNGKYEVTIDAIVKTEPNP